MSSPQSKVKGRPKKYLTEEELKKKKSEDNRKYREKMKAKKEGIDYNEFIGNQDDLNEYKQKINNQRQEADERYKYMTSYMNEINENNNETTFL